MFTVSLVRVLKESIMIDKDLKVINSVKKTTLVYFVPSRNKETKIPVESHYSIVQSKDNDKLLSIRENERIRIKLKTNMPSENVLY